MASRAFLSRKRIHSLPLWSGSIGSIRYVMKFPWQKAEHRQADYTDALTQAILSNAQGDVIQGAAGGLEIAAGLWQTRLQRSPS